MPQVDHLGCYFHYNQAVFRKIQNIGLIIAYRNNRPFQLLCRKIFSLGFLPIDHVITNFDNLKQSGLCRRLKIFFPKIEDLVNYVEKTLILEFLCGTFMIDHKISEQQTPANHGMIPGTDKLEETTHLYE